jgi:hypothetical protein
MATRWDGYSPEVNEGLDLGFWLPPVFRLWRRAFMRESRQLKLLPGEVEILCRHLVGAHGHVSHGGSWSPLMRSRSANGKTTYMNLIRLNLVAHSGSLRFRHDLLPRCNGAPPTACRQSRHDYISLWEGVLTSNTTVKTRRRFRKRGKESQTEKKLATVFLVILIVNPKQITASQQTRQGKTGGQSKQNKTE